MSYNISKNRLRASVPKVIISQDKCNKKKGEGKISFFFKQELIIRKKEMEFRCRGKRSSRF